MTADDLVADFVNAVSGPEADAGECRCRLDDISRLGAREIASTTLMTQRLVAAAGAAGPPVGRQLAELRGLVEALAKRSSGRRERQVRDVVNELDDAKASLDQENAMLDQQQRALSTQAEMLRRYAELTARIDAALAQTDAHDDVKAAVRHRYEILAAHLAVALQADAALRVMVTNNRSLVGAIEVATTTTVAALGAAGAVTHALAELDEINRANVLAVDNLQATVATLAERAALARHA